MFEINPYEMVSQKECAQHKCFWYSANLYHTKLRKSSNAIGYALVGKIGYLPNGSAVFFKMNDHDIIQSIAKKCKIIDINGIQDIDFPSLITNRKEIVRNWAEGPVATENCLYPYFSLLKRYMLRDSPEGTQFCFYKFIYCQSRYLIVNSSPKFQVSIYRHKETAMFEYMKYQDAIIIDLDACWENYWLKILDNDVIE